MFDCYLVELLGGWGRVVTVFCFVLHFLHPLFCVANYCNFIHDLRDQIDPATVTAYLVLTIIACIAYLFIVSAFYMWAWRFPEPEEVAKRRRIYGVCVNVFLSDIPMLVVEVRTVWLLRRISNGLQGFTLVLTCISAGYSILRVWTFLMVKVIKARRPNPGVYPRRAGMAATYTDPAALYGNAVHHSPPGPRPRALELDGSAEDGARFYNDSPTAAHRYSDEGNILCSPSRDGGYGYDYGYDQAAARQTGGSSVVRRGEPSVAAYSPPERW